jgi:HEPN domain-containing protein
MANVAEKWAAQSRYDIETAHAMLDAGRYLYVPFCCQQAVEKMLKALIAKRTGALPPRLHNLMRLAEVAPLTVPEDTAHLFRRLSDFYIASRYPAEMDEAAWTVNPSQARQTYAGYGGSSRMALVNSVIEQRATQALRVLASHMKVRAGFLFGSHVDGMPDAYSDIDLHYFPLHTLASCDPASFAAYVLCRGVPIDGTSLNS